MRIDQLGSRIATAPRGVLIALAVLTALVSPGFIRVSGDKDAQLSPHRERGSLATPSTAVFELGCADGVFSQSCLRFVARVTQALESDPGVTGSVRSLTSTHLIRSERGELQLEPLVARVPATELGLRLLRARIQADPLRARTFVAHGEQSTFVYAELDPTLSADRSSALEASLRQRFERLPRLTVTGRSLGAGESAAGLLFFGGLAVGLATLAIVLAPGGSGPLAALAGAAATAFALFAHAGLGLLGDSARELSRFAPEFVAASAFALSSALIHGTRLASIRESDPRVALATSTRALGPTFAIVALLAASALAAPLVFAPGVPIARGLATATGIAIGLVVYPLGVTLTGLRAWPARLARASGANASTFGRRFERALARPRVLLCVAAVLSALAVCAGAALSPEPGQLQLRSVVLDSGARNGALEPSFLERVQVFQRATEQEPGVLWSSSLVDSVVAPAYRALHDDDPIFATVPPTRADVARALRPWQRDERRALAGQLDSENRRVAVAILVEPARALRVYAAARPFASTLLSLLCVAGIAAATLRSVPGGLICALPGAFTALGILALAPTSGAALSDSAAGLAPLAAGVCSGFALQWLMRVRALLVSHAELEVALSLALRDTGPSIASAALASAAAIALIGAVSKSPAALVALGCLAPLVAAAVALAVAPALVRTARGRFFARRTASRDEVPASEPSGR